MNRADRPRMTEHERRYRAESSMGSASSNSERTGGGPTTASLPARRSSELPQPAAVQVQLSGSPVPSNDFERDPFGLMQVQMTGNGGDVAADHTLAMAAGGVSGSG